MKLLGRHLMARVARLNRKIVWAGLSIALLDDERISALNRIHFGKSEVTDVISFRYAVPHPSGSRFLAEVAVNVDCALREGVRRGGSSRELALYIAHGCNHTAGGTDRNALERKRMRSRENRWLREIGAEIDLSRLITPIK